MSTSINQKIVKDNLSKWDELSPLKEQQIKSILILSQLNQFHLDESDPSDSFDSQSAINSNQTSKDKSKQINSLHQVSSVTAFPHHNIMLSLDYQNYRT